MKLFLAVEGCSIDWCLVSHLLCGPYVHHLLKIFSKAMEKASKSQAIKDAIGEPMVKGPWYNASLAVAHKRHSVSCTFPVSGPHGNGVFQLKAVRNGGLCFIYLFSFFYVLYVWLLLRALHIFCVMTPLCPKSWPVQETYADSFCANPGKFRELILCSSLLLLGNCIIFLETFLFLLLSLSLGTRTPIKLQVVGAK